MGSQLTHTSRFTASVEGMKNPEVDPRVDRPPTFDPHYGFENGRKERKMKATWQEMEDWQLEPDERDYCAHILIDWKRCNRAFLPLTGYKCDDKMHRYHMCEYGDAIIRMKEFERERRLLKRRQRKRLAAEKENLDG